MYKRAQCKSSITLKEDWFGQTKYISLKKTFSVVSALALALLFSVSVDFILIQVPNKYSKP